MIGRSPLAGAVFACATVCVMWVAGQTVGFMRYGFDNGPFGAESQLLATQVAWRGTLGACADVAAFPEGDSAWGCRQLMGNSLTRTSRCSRSSEVVKLAKIPDGIFMLEPLKAAKHGTSIDRFGQPPVRISKLESIRPKNKLQKGYL
jgi:hypothetical protein